MQSQGNGTRLVIDYIPPIATLTYRPLLKETSYGAIWKYVGLVNYHVNNSVTYTSNTIR